MLHLPKCAVNLTGLDRSWGISDFPRLSIIYPAMLLELPEVLEGIINVSLIAASSFYSLYHVALVIMSVTTFVLVYCQSFIFVRNEPPCHYAKLFSVVSLSLPRLSSILTFPWFRPIPVLSSHVS